jgi:AraC-like DNA-binding protein
MLRDPKCDQLKIGEIAVRSGFGDISHFNRSFRHTFGDTPFGVRVRARRNAAGSAQPRARAAVPQTAGQAVARLA